MAYPLPVGKHDISAGARTLEKRPYLAQMIGMIANGWSILDRQTTYTYALLMNQGPFIEGFAAPLEPVALQVFTTIETQQKRMELLTKLAEWRVKNPQLLAELNETVIPSIRRAAKLRNVIMHSVWGITDAYPDALIQLPVFGHQMIFETRDFDDALQRVLDATGLLMAFHMKVADGRKPTHRLVGEHLVEISNT